MRARCPVDDLLELAREGPVVLRRGEQDRVGAPDLLAQAGDLGGRVRLVVLVVGRDPLEALEQLDVDALGRHRGSCPQERRVMGSAAQASRDREDSHRYAALTAETLTSSLTSL